MRRSCDAATPASNTKYREGAPVSLTRGVFQRARPSQLGGVSPPCQGVWAESSSGLLDSGTRLLPGSLTGNGNGIAISRAARHSRADNRRTGQSFGGSF
jgi:hypothetical protein